MRELGAIVRGRVLGRCALVVLGACVSLGLTAAEGRATPTTSVLDVSSSGALANNTTNAAASVSADGRYVAFISRATNLVPGATDGNYHAYLRDRATGSTTQLDIGPGGAQGMSEAGTAMSADGRYVVFTATGSGLVDGVSGPAVYRYDRVAGTLMALPAPPAGDTPVLLPSISADGSRIVYETETSDDQADVFLWNAATGGTTEVDETADGARADGGGANPVISADGNQVAFGTSGQNFASGTSQSIVAEKDLTTGALTEVSLGVSGAQPNDPSYAPSIDGDGCVVAFVSTANNLVAGTSGDPTRLYDRDVCAGTTELASVTANGTPATIGTSSSSVSADGCRIAFPTYDAVTPAQSPSDGLAVALRDRCAGSTTRLDVTTSGQPGDGYSNGGTISGGTGRYVVFASQSNVLLGATGTGPSHLFVRDLDTNTAPTAVLTVSTSGSTVTADASGSSDPDGYDLQTSLSFGDGSAAQVGARAVHTYAAPGGYIVTATVTDSDGVSSSKTALVTIAAAAGTAPGGGGTGSGGTGGTNGGGGGSGGGRAGRLLNPLTIARAALTRRRFAVISGSHAVDATHGSRLLVEVNEAATLTVTFERYTVGHRSRGHCRTTAGAQGRRCVTYVAEGALTRRVLAGTSRLPLTGTVGHTRLIAGHYRLLVSAHLRGGRPTATRTLGFTIEPSVPSTRHRRRS